MRNEQSAFGRRLARLQSCNPSLPVHVHAIRVPVLSHRGMELQRIRLESKVEDPNQSDTGKPIGMLDALQSALFSSSG
jgi:hypothetical protein